MIMDKPVELTINEFDLPINLVFALHEHFDDFFQALKFIAETMKRIQILQFKLESADCIVSYKAMPSSNMDRGEYFIKLKTQALNLEQMGELLNALDYELNHHWINHAKKGADRHEEGSSNLGES